MVAPKGAKECCLLLAKATNKRQIRSIGNQTGGRVGFFLFTDDFWRDYYRMKDRQISFVRPPTTFEYGIVAVLHWINAEVWGNLTQMTILFTFTFSMGLLLAFSYAKTFSIIYPFAIHFGWNLTQNYIFPDTSTGNHIFTLVAPPPEVTISYLAFFTMLLLPKISVLIVNYFIIKKHRQVEIP